jgi:hypothetical protein
VDAPLLAIAPTTAQSRFRLVQAVQLTTNVGDSIADLSSDTHAAGTAPVGAQVIGGLYLHAEIFGKLAGRQNRLMSEPKKFFSVHTPKAFEVIPDDSNWVVHLLYEHSKKVDIFQ